MATHEICDCICQAGGWSIASTLTLLAVFVALFGERMWKLFDGKRKRSVVRQVLIQLLESAKENLERIRDERNRNDESNSSIKFSDTSMGEIEHYADLLQTLIIPNLVDLKLPENSKTVQLLNQIRQNISVARKKGFLKEVTVNALISDTSSAISELSS